MTDPKVSCADGIQGHLSLPHWAEQGSWEWVTRTGKHLIRHWAARGETPLGPRALMPAVVRKVPNCSTHSAPSPGPRCLPPDSRAAGKAPSHLFPSSVYMDTVVQKIKGSALVTDIKPALDSHISSTASCSPFSCCTMQPTLLLKRRDRLPFWELLPCTDLSFFKRRLFLLHIPRMSQMRSVPSWEAVYSSSLWICNNRVTLNTKP